MMAPNNHRLDRTQDVASQRDLETALAALARVARDDARTLERVTALSERLRNETFHLAVLGQFKRGKSTLINALLGAPLLPVAVVPLTAVPIFVSWGAQPRVVVSFLGDRAAEELAAPEPARIRDFLLSFATEKANPKNRIGVKRVDLTYPAELLSNGIVLIDTPGVGSTYRHNTNTAFEILSECDAALFVVSVDPPITEVELGFLRDIKAKTAKLMFALNKIDYLAPDQRAEVANFLRRTLRENDLWDGRSSIFGLSAQKGLEAKERGDRAGVVLSGLSSIEEYLGGVLSSQKANLLRAAIQAKGDRILSEYIAATNLRIRTLELPLNDLLARSAAFRDALVSIEAQRLATRDILDGDRRRLRQELEERIEQLRATARPKFETIASLLADPESNQEQASGAIVDIFEMARRDFQEVFKVRFDQALQLHQRRISELIDKVRHTAGTIFNARFPAWSEFDGFEFGADPYWVTEKIPTGMIPVSSGIVDHLLPATLRTHRRYLRTLHNLEEVALRNAENLRWAVLRGIDESFRRADQYCEAQIGEVIATTTDIIGETMERRQSASTVADRELKELATKAALLGTLKECFQPSGCTREAVGMSRDDQDLR
jgi:GTP-binding protein EngB required for normal cell division